MFQDWFRLYRPDELQVPLQLLEMTYEGSCEKHEGSNRKWDQHTAFEGIVQGIQKVQDGNDLHRSGIPEQKVSCFEECAATAPNTRGCGQGWKEEDTQPRWCS